MGRNKLAYFDSRNGLSHQVTTRKSSRLTNILLIRAAFNWLLWFLRTSSEAVTVNNGVQIAVDEEGDLKLVLADSATVVEDASSAAII